MNKLKPELQEQVIGALVEGNSIRSIERMTGIHRDSIMRLGLRVGEACQTASDAILRDLNCGHIQVDEIWCYVGKKQRHVHVTDDESTVGDFWTWVAIDSDTKLVPSYVVGKRTAETANAFVTDLASRLANRVQLSSDGLRLYLEAIEAGFGGAVDYATIVKAYEAEPVGPGRYSPPKVISQEKTQIVGLPDMDMASTSYVERQNLTMRMQMRRFTRLTNAFSKKPENLRAAVGLHFAYYNFVRVHQTIKTTPAIAAGVIKNRWTIRDLIGIAS